MNDVKNILIVRTDRMGDVVLTTPVIQALRDHFFEAQISMLVTPLTSELVKGHPALDHVLVDDRDGAHRGLVGFWRLVRMLRRHQFDLALILHTKKRTNLACAWAGIPQRMGYKNNKYGKLLTHPLTDERHHGHKHEVEYCLDVVKELGVSIKEKPQLYVPTQSYAEQSVMQLLQAKEVGAEDKIVALHPGASDPTKCWPTKSFGELAKQLLERPHTKVFIVGSHECQDAAKQIRRYTSNHVVDVTGKLTVAQLVSLLKRCATLVSNDSGPVHVAAALDTPVISLFLRSQQGINPERWKPWAERVVTLMNKSGEEIILDDQGQCVSGRFDSICVEDVYRHVMTFLEG